jgi:undecaprenyl diphosphate synthase
MKSAESPQHVAIIMDGNGRWAQARGMPRIEGHRRGAAAVRQAIEGAMQAGCKYLTLYCFSTENWKRPKIELDFLMQLLQHYLTSELAELKAQSIRLNTIGRLNELTPKIQQQIRNAREQTVDCDKLVLTLAINYGGRQEIADAVKKIGSEVAAGKLSPDNIDEQTIHDFLYTADLPDPDLLIRTSGELRLSNFLLWQLSYAEIVILDSTWPEFTKEHFLAAVEQFSNRQRRFGGLAPK